MILWKLNKELRLRIVAEAPNLNILVKIYCPLGLFDTKTATYIGDNQYEVAFTPNEEGLWYVVWIFPDDFSLIHYIVVRKDIQDSVDEIIKLIKQHDAKMMSIKWI